MSKYVVAVSGGVDSVVLLDMLTKQPGLGLVVAHFDHGIRDDSASDAEFVAELAKKYSFPFETKREELGSGASEGLARDRRYEFLRSVAKKHGAKLVTAHHADDVVETVAINHIRGTGWRGLAVLDSDVLRPLTDMTKSEIINYANKHGLTWHEDSTNQQDIYLRNKVRRKIHGLDEDTRRQLLGLWSEQKNLKRQIDKEVGSLIQNEYLAKGSTLSSYSRYFISNVDQTVAIEILRYITDGRLTRPQLQNALIAIKTNMPGKIFQAGNGVNINFTPRNFTVELLK